MASNVPNVKLNSGFNIPLIGLGTWNVSSAEIYSLFVLIFSKLNARFIHLYKFACSVYTCVRLITLDSVVFH